MVQQTFDDDIPRIWVANSL